MIKERKKEKRILNIKKFLLMSGMSFITMTTGCGDTRIEDIDTYYLLRVADESGTKADIVYVYNTDIANINNYFKDGCIKSYYENYYELGTKGFDHNFSPIQLIPYTDIVNKDTYYEENVSNTEENLEYISSELESYAFLTHPTYTFGDETYEYTCHVYEIKDKQTKDVRYVVGYPTIIEEVNPTQIYDALSASFIYLKTSEYATLIPSDIDDLDTFTLEEARTILEEVNKKENGQSRTLTPTR